MEHAGRAAFCDLLQVPVFSVIKNNVNDGQGLKVAELPLRPRRPVASQDKAAYPELPCVEGGDQVCILVLHGAKYDGLGLVEHICEFGDFF